MTGFFVYVFIIKVDSNQYIRSCVQDGLLNDSQKLGVPMSKKKLYAYLAADEFHGIKLRKELFLQIFQSQLQFCVINVEILKGGAE